MNRQSAERILRGDGFTICECDDFEHAGDKWCLARKSLGIKSFGMNVIHLAPGEDIPEHDELDRDQEEVFIVLSGRATLVIDGETHPLRAGAFARLDPKPMRYVRNDSEDACSVLIVSAPTTSGYEPMEWA